MSEPQYTLIADLKPSMRSLHLRFIVLDVNKATRTKEGQEVCTVKIADKSGAVNLTVWNELCTQVEPSDICMLHNAYTNIWKGALTVQTGKQGELKRVGQFNFVFSDAPDLSAAVYVEGDSIYMPPVATTVATPLALSAPVRQSSSNGSFTGRFDRQRHDSFSSSSPAPGVSAPTNPQYSTSRSDNGQRPSESVPLPTSNPPQAPAVTKTSQVNVGNGNGNGNCNAVTSAPSSQTSAVAVNSLPTAATTSTSSASSLNAFRQAFIQQSAANSVNATRASVSSTSLPAVSPAARAATTPGPTSTAQQPATTAHNSKVSANEPTRKLYREIDMFASVPPEKKARSTVASPSAPTQQKKASADTTPSKAKGEQNLVANAGLPQAAVKK